MIDTDKLIEQWKEGDESAARLLYEQYYLQIFRLACGLLDSIEDAEEVMQNTLTFQWVQAAWDMMVNLSIVSLLNLPVVNSSF